jgi:hypothetical protein
MVAEENRTPAVDVQTVHASRAAQATDDTQRWG